MWPFDRKPTKPPVAGSFDSQELGAIARRLDELARRVEGAEKKVETLDVDWSEWYDKFRRLYARIAKRQERDEDAAQAAQDGQKSQQDAPQRTIERQLGPNGGPVATSRRNY
jgi:chromosome segregation ATPase